jgi:hypothetical protein
MPLKGLFYNCDHQCMRQSLTVKFSSKQSVCYLEKLYWSINTEECILVQIFKVYFQEIYIPGSSCIVHLILVPVCECSNNFIYFHYVLRNNINKVNSWGLVLHSNPNMHTVVFIIADLLLFCWWRMEINFNFQYFLSVLCTGQYV